MKNSECRPVEFVICQDAHDLHKSMKDVVEKLNKKGHRANLECVDHVDDLIRTLDKRHKDTFLHKKKKPALPTDIIMDVSGGNGAQGAKKVIQWFEKHYPDAPLPSFNFLSLNLDMAITDAKKLRISDGRIPAGAIDVTELTWTQKRLRAEADPHPYLPYTTAFRTLLNNLFNADLAMDQGKDEYYREKLQELEAIANDGVASEWLRGNLSAEKAIEGTRAYFQDLAKTLKQSGVAKDEKPVNFDGLKPDVSFYGCAGMPQKGIVVFNKEQAFNAGPGSSNPILILRSYDPSVVPLMASGRIAGVVVMSTYMASHLKLLCETHGVTGLFGVAHKGQMPRDAFNEEARPDESAYFGEDDKVNINGQEISAGNTLLIGLEGNGLMFAPPADLKTKRPTVQKIAEGDLFRIQTMKRCFEKFFRDQGMPVHGVKANVDSISRGQVSLPGGIGLVRTEQMVATNGVMRGYLKEILLDNSENARRNFCSLQRREYRAIIVNLANGPVKIRLFDFVHSEILNKSEQKEFLQKYPKLNIHGSAAIKAWPDLYRDQVKTIFRTLQDYPAFDRPLEIMMPAVRTEEDVLAIKKIVEEEAKTIGISAERYSFGVMAETLDACKNIEAIVRHCDFISFGTNDLTQQYTGMARGDLKAHAKYAKQNGFDPFKMLAPEVLDIVRDTTSRGRQANPELRVDICGAQAADIETALRLFDIGVDNISVAPTPENIYALPMLLNYRRYDALKNKRPQARNAPRRSFK